MIISDIKRFGFVFHVECDVGIYSICCLTECCINNVCLVVVFTCIIDNNNTLFIDSIYYKLLSLWYWWNTMVKITCVVICGVTNQKWYKDFPTLLSISLHTVGFLTHQLWDGKTKIPPGVLYNYNGIPGISDMRRSRKVPSLSLIYLSLVDGEGVSLVSSYRENRADLSLNICACLLPLATRDPISSSRRNLRQWKKSMKPQRYQFNESCEV